MIRRLTSFLAWRRFQSAFRRQERAAQKRHGRVNDVRRQRQAIVHAALASNQGRA